MDKTHLLQNKWPAKVYQRRIQDFTERRAPNPLESATENQYKNSLEYQNNIYSTRNYQYPDVLQRFLSTS